METEIDKTQVDVIEAEVQPEDAGETGDTEFKLDTTVSFAGRSFELVEPTPSTILSILNVIAEIGIRAEKKVRRIYKADSDEVTGAGGGSKKKQIKKTAGTKDEPPVENPVNKMMENPSSMSVVYGFMAAMTPRDLVNFGLAVLQLGDNDDDAKWLKENMKIAPLIDAFFIDLALSDDLREAIKSFLKGASILTAVIEAFGGLMNGQ